jgi:xanthine dehydrogenase D subunit
VTAPALTVRGGIGESVPRADAVPKVTGAFAYSSDLMAGDMLWGATLRSPVPHARLGAIATRAARALPGVHAVLTHADVPGLNRYGLEHADQPVLAEDEVRFQGEPVALVAADHPETARRAAALIAAELEPLPPLTDPERALAAGRLVRHVRIEHGDPGAHAEVVVRGEYEVGMQDQAFLGPESGLATPSGDGGVELAVATQWLHADRDQVAASLGLAPEKVRITLAGVGGAFGAREDISMQVHACLLALRTGRPVKMSYGREESFAGHVHRHPARLRYEHGATADGRLVYVRARVLLDGGAYASTTGAVCSNAASFACGPYVVPNARVDAYGLYTNNPPCGAMRGFGAVQVAFAYESQMDRLARELRMDPVELRCRNALAEGERLPTGQAIRGPAPVPELLERLRDRPLPPAGGPLPGDAGGTTRGEGVRRGVGYAVGIKNTAFSEGFDDYATALVRLLAEDGEVVAEVQSAAAEVGQGVAGVQAQIVRTELLVERVRVLGADTHIGSAGSSSASRQTYMTGGAVKLACDAVRELVLERAALPAAELRPGAVVAPDGEAVPLAALLAAGPLEATRVHHHRPTEPLDARGQGDQHLAFAFAAHRAVVDVDVELGTVRVVEVAAAQDVGRAINPQALEGQIEGGTVQGIGLALMEELQLRDGELLTTSFTDYHIPTVLDVGRLAVDVLECPDPGAPYGLRGVGEPPTISSTPAVVAALRAATGRELTRVPVRPDDLLGL